MKSHREFPGWKPHNSPKAQLPRFPQFTEIQTMCSLFQPETHFPEPFSKPLDIAVQALQLWIFPGV